MTSHLPAHALALFIISRQDDADAAAFMRGVGLKPLTLEVNPSLCLFLRVMRSSRRLQDGQIGQPIALNVFDFRVLNSWQYDRDGCIGQRRK